MRSLFAIVLSFPAVATAQIQLPDPVSSDDFHAVEADWVALGRQLFFDPLLSGNENIACATCHHPSLGTADAMSLSLGEGATGLGVKRVADVSNLPKQRIPRNAPALWNLGAKEFVVMFHDGRVESKEDAPNQMRMPAGRDLERALPSPLAAQNILPLLSGDEMAGHAGENPIADAVAEERIAGAGGAWDIISGKVENVIAYQTQFTWLTGREDVHITDIARALSSFIGFEFRATNSPFDAYLNDEDDALSAPEMRGMNLFYGAAGCSTCHSGPFQTDHGFHSIGLPQFGPGKEEEAIYSYADFGRAMVTGEADDRYRFRTPSLRNIALTAPYGHNGAFGTLEGMVRHHLDPIASLTSYDRSEAKLHALDTSKDDWQALENVDEIMSIAASVEITPVSLSDAEIDDLLAFLNALTDRDAQRGRLGVPDSVPSGLPLDPS